MLESLERLPGVSVSGLDFLPCIPGPPSLTKRHNRIRLSRRRTSEKDSPMTSKRGIASPELVHRPLESQEHLGAAVRDASCRRWRGDGRPPQGDTRIWKEDGDRAVPRWRTGWTTKIAREGDRYIHTSYRNGTSPGATDGTLRSGKGVGRSFVDRALALAERREPCGGLAYSFRLLSLRRPKSWRMSTP